MATVGSQVGFGHHYVDYGGRVFKQSAEQLRHISERERQALDAGREAEGGEEAEPAPMEDEEMDLPEVPPAEDLGPDEPPAQDEPPEEPG